MNLLRSCLDKHLIYFFFITLLILFSATSALGQAGLQCLANDCNLNGISDTEEIASGAPDIDHNGIIDFCQEDCNNNFIPDSYELSPNSYVPNELQHLVGQDMDENGIPDTCQTDCNGNTIPDSYELSPNPYIPLELQFLVGVDTDENGVPDSCQTDCNGNTIPDSYELSPNPYIPLELQFLVGIDTDENGVPDSCQTDCNGNRIPDSHELDPNAYFNQDQQWLIGTDLDNDGVPDSCQADCNNNDSPDTVDIESGSSSDTNQDQVPDECENPVVGDCNFNGINDVTEIANNEMSCGNDCTYNTIDEDQNGQIDACEVDCNTNGFPDVAELALSQQCHGDFCPPQLDDDQNGIIDACEADCNKNWISDLAELAYNQQCHGEFCPPQLDDDQNGIIDACEDDCNKNSIPDPSELAYSQQCQGDFCPPRLDFNGNGVIDSCEEDCNKNGFPDPTELQETPQPCSGIYCFVATDADANGVLDTCQSDCNYNTEPDSFEIMNNPSLDQDQNQEIDLCEVCADCASSFGAVKPIEGIVASASSSYNSAYGPELAVDSSSTTFWAGASGAASWEFTLDLGGLHKLNSLKLNFYHSHYAPANMDLQVSVTGNHFDWITTHSGLNPKASPTSPTYQIDFDGEDVAFVRLVMDQVSFVPLLSNITAVGQKFGDCAGTTEPDPIQYCDSSASFANMEWIAGVGLGGTVHNSSGGSGYEDLTAVEFEVARQSTTPLTLTPGYSGFAFPEYWAVWIDFNHDGDFSDADEQVFQPSSGNSTSVNGAIYIPHYATEGRTRMRVQMSYYNSQIGACSNPFTYGQVEDYSITIR